MNIRELPKIKGSSVKEMISGREGGHNLMLTEKQILEDMLLHGK